MAIYMAKVTTSHKLWVSIFIFVLVFDFLGQSVPSTQDLCLCIFHCNWPYARYLILLYVCPYLWGVSSHSWCLCLLSFVFCLLSLPINLSESSVCLSSLVRCVLSFEVSRRRPLRCLAPRGPRCPEASWSGAWSGLIEDWDKWSPFLKGVVSIWALLERGGEGV